MLRSTSCQGQCTEYGVLRTIPASPYRQVPDLEVLGTQTTSTSGPLCSAAPYAGYYLIVRSVQAADMTSTDPNPARIPVPSSGAPEVWGWSISSGFNTNVGVKIQPFALVWSPTSTTRCNSPPLFAPRICQGREACIVTYRVRYGASSTERGKPRAKIHTTLWSILSKSLVLALPYQVVVLIDSKLVQASTASCCAPYRETILRVIANSFTCTYATDLNARGLQLHVHVHVHVEHGCTTVRPPVAKPLDPKTSSGPRLP